MKSKARPYFGRMLVGAGLESLHWHLISNRLTVPLYAGARGKVRREWPRDTTKLVVEGFPRSGNTYVRAVLVHANPDLSGSVTSHLHTACSVERAVSLGVPVLILVRRPEDAVASLCVREALLPPGKALRRYVRFYEGVRALTADVVVAGFSEATQDLGRVADRLNARFDMQLTAPHESQDEESAVLEIVEESGQRVRLWGRVKNDITSQPSSARALALQAMRERVLESPVYPYAEATYQEWSQAPA